MTDIIRVTSNTNELQRLVMPLGYAGNVTAYLWGGGGGGGGSDANPGGKGCGAMCAVKTFSVVPGDIIDVAVGAGGGWGGNDAAGQNSHPGVPGASYNTGQSAQTIWTTRNSTQVIPYEFNAWSPFFNTYGVKAFNQPFQVVIQEQVNFPTSDYYTFTGTSYQTFSVEVDGNLVLSGTNIQTLYDARAFIPAGSRTVRIVATFSGYNSSVNPSVASGPNWYGQPASVAVTIQTNAGFTQSLSYGGGFGGTSGTNGISGAGGGGGGATVLFLNSSVIAVAGGGGGGGGGGYNSAPVAGQDAPGDRGQEPGTTAGQNGTNKPGDGGGGGGGGGGYIGGNGGSTPGGDSGGYAGMYGGSLGDVTYVPIGVVPGGANLSQYRNGGGTGGINGVRGVRNATSGGNGVAVLVFTPLTYQINIGGTWNPIQKAFVKVNGEWKESRNVFVKSNGIWNVIVGSSDDYAPAFSDLPGYYGYNPRPGVGGGGGGGGGCKIICEKLAEMGYFDSAMNAADQQFGLALRDQDPDAYNGYLRWAQPVVELLEGGGSSTFRKIVFPWIRDEQRRRDLQTKIVAHYLDMIARPWAEEMAFRMQAPGYDSSNPAGRFIMNIGLPMCRSIGKLNQRHQLPMWAKTALIWGITTVLLVAVTVISTMDKVTNKIFKFFKRG